MLLIKQIKNLKFACEKHKKIKRNDMSNNTGKVSQIIGPVVDVVFNNNENKLPNIYDSLEITRENGSKLVLECQQHIGEDTVRAIAMETTDGISRGVDVVATGAPIMMPAGENIKGRVFNVIGDAIDGMENLSTEGGLPIHREAPKFEDLSTSTEVLFTEIISKLVKQRKDSAQIYNDQNRADLEKDELAQLRHLEHYLPKQLSEQEVNEILDEIIVEQGADSMKDMGRVMTIATEKLSGLADGKLIAALVRNKLQ